MNRGCLSIQIQGEISRERNLDSERKPMLRTFRKQKKREKTVDTEILTKVFLKVNTQKEEITYFV